MAWDDYDFGNLTLISGDTTFDELGGAVKRIRKAYLERFGRSPYLAELLYTLCQIAEYASPSVVEDTTLPSIDMILSALAGPTSSDQIDPGKYEAYFDDEGDTWVAPILASSGPSKPSNLGEPVLRLTVENTGLNVVLCRYTILSDVIADSAARCMIRYCVLSGLYNYNLADPDFRFRFESSPITTSDNGSPQGS